MSVLIEIVCCSVDDAVSAERGGAHRIELCAALGQGGLTPSPGLFLSVKEHCSLPIVAMVRPRAGGFHYTDLEFDSMLRDLEWLVENGADAIVTGCLTEDGYLDEERNAELHRRANGVPMVSHRCFDVVRDPASALEQFVAIGFRRILTSGRQNNALDGAHEILRNIEQAAGRIEILPGGGIRADNAREIVALTGANQIHLAPFKRVSDSSTQGNPTIYFAGSLNMEEGLFDTTDEDAVRATIQSLA